MTAPTAGPRHLHPDATRVLVLGFLGVTICPITAPLAWRLGTRVVAEIDGSGLATRNRPSAVVGRWCGVVGTILWGGVLAIGLVLALIGALQSLG